MSDYQNTWLLICKDVILAAKKQIPLKEYDLNCRIAESKIGQSYFDRIRALEKLQLEGLIVIDQGALKLRRSSFPSWLQEGLHKGNEQSWDIFEILDQGQTIFKKVNREVLEKIGLDGEMEVLKNLKSFLYERDFNKVKHLSLIDDSLGYDIMTPSVKNPENILLYEVKTSSRKREYFDFYISRNEVQVASRNANWYLIAVLKVNDQFEIIGNLRYELFQEFLPQDQSPLAKWESAHLRIPLGYFEKQLP